MNGFSARLLKDMVPLAVCAAAFVRGICVPAVRMPIWRTMVWRPNRFPVKPKCQCRPLVCPGCEIPANRFCACAACAGAIGARVPADTTRTALDSIDLSIAGKKQSEEQNRSSKVWWMVDGTVNIKYGVV